jgi:basic membrane protein A
MKRLVCLVIFGAAVAYGSAAMAADVKVAYLPCGKINDGSWSQVGYEGMKAVQSDLAAAGTTMTLDYTESVPAAQVETAARDYASRGYQVVVLYCGNFGDAAVNAAKAFPGTTFLLSTPPPAGDMPANFWAFDAAQQEATFMAGYLGGSLSKTGTVSEVGGVAFPALARQMEGFLLGARYANPQIKTLATYTDSFDDAGKAKEAAQAQIDSGSDVLFAATDQAARGVFSAADSAGVYAIASYSDQSSLAPNAIVASVIYDYIPIIKSMVIGAVEKKLDPGKKLYLFGVESGVGTLVLNPKLESVVPADLQQKLTGLVDDIKAGHLKIPPFSKPGEAAAVDLNSLHGN